MKPKQLTLILAVILGAVVVGGLIAFFVSQNMVATKVNTIQRTSGDIKLETDQLERLARLEQAYTKVAPIDKKAQSVLPAQKDQDQVIAQVSTLVRQQGLNVDGLSFEKTSGLPSEKSQTQPGQVGGILVMPVKFQAVGTYTQLVNLLKSFEQQQRYMQVTSLDVTRQDDGRLNFNMSINVFLKP